MASSEIKIGSKELNLLLHEPLSLEKIDTSSKTASLWQTKFPIEDGWWLPSQLSTFEYSYNKNGKVITETYRKEDKLSSFRVSPEKIRAIQEMKKIFLIDTEIPTKRKRLIDQGIVDIKTAKINDQNKKGLTGIRLKRDQKTFMSLWIKYLEEGRGHEFMFSNYFCPGGTLTNVHAVKSLLDYAFLIKNVKAGDKLQITTEYLIQPFFLILAAPEVFTKYMRKEIKEEDVRNFFSQIANISDENEDVAEIFFAGILSSEYCKMQSMMLKNPLIQKRNKVFNYLEDIVKDRLENTVKFIRANALEQKNASSRNDSSPDSLPHLYQNITSDNQSYTDEEVECNYG